MKKIIISIILFILIGFNQDVSSSQNIVPVAINYMQDGDISLECNGKFGVDKEEIKINIIYSKRIPEISKIYNQLTTDDKRQDYLPSGNLILRKNDIDKYIFDIQGFYGIYYVLEINRKNLNARLLRFLKGASNPWLSEDTTFKCIKSDQKFFNSKAVEHTNKIKLSNSLNKI